MDLMRFVELHRDRPAGRPRRRGRGRDHRHRDRHRRGRAGACRTRCSRPPGRWRCSRCCCCRSPWPSASSSGASRDGWPRRAGRPFSRRGGGGGQRCCERRTSSLLYHAIAVSRSATSHCRAARRVPGRAGRVHHHDRPERAGALAGAVWLAFGLYAVVNLAALQTTVLALLIALLTGRAIGLGVRYAAGTMSQRPAAGQIAAALGGAGCELVEIRRVPPVGHESRRYAATARGGDRLDVCVYDRDQEAAGAIYRLYRSARLEDQVSHSAPVSVDRMVERRALLSYAARGGRGAHPPAARPVRVGPRGHRARLRASGGTTLAEQDRTPTDAGARPRLGCGAPAARSPRHPPGADLGPHPAHRRRPGHAARRATATSPRATCSFASTWPSSSPSWRCGSGRRTGARTWRWTSSARTS